MPHIDISCYPGRSEAQKQLLAEKITQDIAEVFGCKESSVSVAIHDVSPENWKAEVWNTYIKSAGNDLIRKPGYICED